MDDDEHELEGLVPRNFSVFGLRMADADEAKTVQRVSYATLVLAAIYVMHFIVHVSYYGHPLHALAHLFFGIALPAFGYYAIKRQSTGAVYTFHFMNVVAGFTHFVVLLMVGSALIEIAGQDPGVACSHMVAPAHACPEAYAYSTHRGAFSKDKRVWRCKHGACISAAGRCDREPNCFDHSDEEACSVSPFDSPFSFTGPAQSVNQSQSNAPSPTGNANEDWDRNVAQAEEARAEAAARRRCELKVDEMRKKAPRLQAWWFTMALPIWCLNVFAAYHALELYVQLRVRALKARMGSSQEATVYEDQAQGLQQDAEDVHVE